MVAIMCSALVTAAQQACGGRMRRAVPDWLKTCEKQKESRVSADLLLVLECCLRSTDAGACAVWG